MKVILSIGFDTRVNGYFKIINPPVVPLEGEIFFCKWDDWITESEKIKNLEEYEDGNLGIWRVRILSKKYEKTQVTVNISLVEDRTYKIEAAYSPNL